MNEKATKAKTGVKAGEIGKETKDVFIGLRITPSVDAMLTVLAEEERRGKAELIRMALSDWIDMRLTGTCRDALALVQEKRASILALANTLDDESIEKLHSYLGNESSLARNYRGSEFSKLVAKLGKPAKR